MRIDATSIRLVCLDLGGVIIRICRSWAEGCAAAGLDVRAADKRPKTEAARRQVVVDYQTGRIDCDTFARRLSDILEGVYTPEEIMAVHRAWCIEEYAGVGEAIDAIHAAGLDTACLSNTNHSHWAQIGSYPAFRKIRTKLASHLMGLHKPDEAIYREAERRLNVRGGEILFFDDLEDNVLAARAAGWNAVQVDPAGRTDEQIMSALDLVER